MYVEYPASYMKYISSLEHTYSPIGPCTHKSTLIQLFRILPRKYTLYIYIHIYIYNIYECLETYENRELSKTMTPKLNYSAFHTERSYCFSDEIYLQFPSVSVTILFASPLI